MLRAFGTRSNCLNRMLTCTGESADPIMVPADSLWVDLYDPTPQEREAVKALVGFEPPSREDMEEIEISSRLYQEDGAMFMTALILSKAETESPESLGISFILAGDRLLTVRYSDPQPINTFANRAARQAGQWARGDLILAGLLEAIIDRTADVLEKVGAEVDALSKQIFSSGGPSRDFQKILLRLGNRNDLTSKARESLISMGRMLAFMAVVIDTKSSKEMKNHIKVMTRDVQSLADHTTFLSNSITFLLDAVLGVVNVEQSRIIKIFSVVAVVFLPPTLVASIYGMNFHYLPELKWTFGYPLSLALMVVSAILPYLYFKWRGWM
ncbi:MAG: magnesium/cobalt transporter CorA [Alphaproteobacteria bacterium]|nr:magnesium/cobalt transporter CorA [Alphaproteobacteria bacterium]